MSDVLYFLVKIQTSMYTNDMRGTSNVRQPGNMRDQPDALWTQRLVSGQSRAHKTDWNDHDTSHRFY